MHKSQLPKRLLKHLLKWHPKKQLRRHQLKKLLPQTHLHPRNHQPHSYPQLCSRMICVPSHKGGTLFIKDSSVHNSVVESSAIHASRHQCMRGSSSFY